MKRLSKEKRDKIILVAVGTLVALGVLWFGMIRMQQASLEDKAKQMEQAVNQLTNARRLVANANKYETDLEGVRARLEKLEEGMASGDMYSWIIKTMNKFQAPYKVEIPNFTPPAVGDVTIFPKFPYQAATFAVRGTGHFHEFGRFLADFENTFPCIRVQNLELEPIGILSANPQDAEKIVFKMELVTLIKPNSVL